MASRTKPDITYQSISVNILMLSILTMTISMVTLISQRKLPISQHLQKMFRLHIPDSGWNKTIGSTEDVKQLLYYATNNCYRL